MDGCAIHIKLAIPLAPLLRSSLAPYLASALASASFLTLHSSLFILHFSLFTLQPACTAKIVAINGSSSLLTPPIGLM